jgi:thymidylate synthase ThyX
MARVGTSNVNAAEWATHLENRMRKHKDWQNREAERLAMRILQDIVPRIARTIEKIGEKDSPNTTKPMLPARPGINL